MSLPHALLTALVEHPASGYELASRFDRSIGHFWHATHQQIYRELGRLEEAGWVSSSPLENSRGGRKRQYRILPAGRRELQHWIAQPQEPQPLRDELMVRLRAAAVVGHGVALEQELARHLALHRDKLKLYQEIDERDFAQVEDGSPQALQRLVLRAGIRYEELWVGIANDALAALQKRAKAPRRSQAPAPGV